MVNRDINENDVKSYKFMAIFKKDGYIKLMGGYLNFEGESQTYNNPKTIAPAKKYTKAHFNAVHENNEIYFFTYNNISDFSSGYSTTSVSGVNYNDISSVQIKINEVSPFEFVDEVEIQKIDFLLYNQYIHYTFLNKKTNTHYYGLFDVKSNKIIFNTDEELDLFMPYIVKGSAWNPYSVSMLAINKESAYEYVLSKMLIQMRVFQVVEERLFMI